MEEEDLINVGTSPKDKLKLNAYLQNTGKVKNEVDPKYNKIKLSTSQYLQNTSIGKSKYDKNLNFGDLNQQNIDESVNEHRAQEESNLVKIGAGIGRIGTKAISEIAKMPGVIGGIIAAPFAEEGQGWETAFNNQWIKSISQFNEDVNAELLPVYVKKAVSEGNLWDNISSIDFWATEGADGIGFIASMFAPGAALKSLNLGHKILGTTAKGLSMVNGEAKLAGAVRTLEGLGINANKIDMAGITMANTLFESGSEAGSAMDSFQKDIDKKLASGKINQQQYEQLQTQKGKLGRDIFVSNLAILLVPNAIQTKMIWGKGVGSQLVKDTPSLMAKIGNRGKNVLGALGSEGFLEEGSQSTVETMFSNKAKRGELTDNMSQDFNISELVSSYIDTLNTTEGQKAIFLGGFLGGGMSAYQGGKSDIATRKETQDVLTLAEEKVGIFNKINETDVYKRDENGDIVYNYNNKPQYDPVKVKEVAKALQLAEEKSKEFDKAIKEGNEQGLQVLKNEAINQLVTPFINRGELGIQALSQYLDATLKTEEIAENEDAKALKSKIIEQATYMQDQLNSYKDFSKSLINIENPNATKQDIADYYNRLGDVYINLKGSEYFQKGELKKLNTQKTKLLKDLGDTEISTELNPDYIEGKTEEIYKFNNKPVDARVKLLNDQIEEVDKKLSEIDKIINDEIWNNEKVNESFNKKVKENNKLREKFSPEQVAKNDEVIDTVSNALENAESVEDVDSVIKLSTLDYLKNQITLTNEQIEVLEGRNDSVNLFEQYEKLNKLKEQKRLEEENVLKKKKEKEKLEEKKRKALIEQDKKVEKESKKIKVLEKKILLIQNLGNLVKVNGVTGILSKVNDSVFEVENENEIFEINLENLENLEIEKVKSLKERYNVSKISETSVTVNNVEYKINVDNLGNIISLSPKNNSSQKIKNNDLLIAVEIERNKQDFNKRTPVRNIDQRLKDNNYENVANILNTIYNQNLTETVQSALNKLYSEEQLTEQEKLQLGLWIQDAFDRLSNLFNSKNTDLENETLLNSYDNLEIILSLLYGKQLKTTTKEFKNDKSNDIGKTEVGVTSERASKQIESEDTVSKNSEIEKLNKEIEDLKSKITDLNLGTDKIIENFENSLKKTESTFISEANPIITEKLQIQAEVKKAEIIEAEKVVNAEEIANATQEDNDFNDTTTYSDLTGTEGSPVTDELIPTNSENNTTQEVKNVENEEETVGKGAQVISTYRKDDEKGRWKAGDIIDFIKEKFNNFIKYEKEPVDKTGRPVTFEINTNPGPGVKVNEALDLYNTLLKRGFNTMSNAEYNLLYDYLPINARFTPDVNAPIGTKNRIRDKRTGEWVDNMNISTGLLRTQLIANLRNGISIKDMSTTIQSQYKGFLKVDDNRFANNNILELDGVPNLKYVRDNLYVVDSFGNLKNIQTGKTKTFSNDKLKPNAAGEIYLEIPQANGKPFPLKLNIKKINNDEAVLLYYIYREILLNDKALNTTVSQVNDELKALIKNTFKAELGIIGGNENDIKLQDIVDLLIYQSDNIKSRMQLDKDAQGNNVLLYSDGQDGKIATKETIEEDMGAIIDYLENSKRHQIKIDTKFATDNTKTNLKSNNADYLKYLINNGILTTNAVVGKDKDGNNIPTFQGYTNIYLNTSITVTNQPKVSEQGVEADNNDFGDLDFDDKQTVTQSITGLSITYTPTGKQSQTYTVNKNKIFNFKGEEVFKEDSADRRKIFANVAVKEWDENHGDRKFLINAYNSLKQPKVSEEGVQISADDIGLDDAFETEPKVDDNVLNKIKSFAENNSNNPRNSQESFVSLSEIKGTMENTELNKTQTEVFNETKTSLLKDAARMAPIIQKYKESLKESGQPLSDRDQARLNKWAEENPEAYKKICQ